MTRALAATALLAGVAVPATGSVASAGPSSPTEPNGGQAVEECRGSIDPRPCRQFEQLLRLGAQLCRFAGVPETACSVVDGRVYDEAAVAAFEDGPVAEALRFQDALDDHVPLGEALIPATHNSNNAAAYAPTLSGLDHNQVATITDQLRMGMRGLELDLHWFPSPSGSLEHGGFAPILCHGQSEAFGPTTVHIGCTAERHLREGLAEIDQWLDAHPDEFVLLYLENQLDDDVVAHDAAATTITEVIGDHVFPTATGNCDPMPNHLSEADVVASGAQVVLVGNAGPGDAWCSLVHERFGSAYAWRESKSPEGEGFDCAADQAANPPASTFRRIYEDSTWLSYTAEPTGFGSPGEITPAETAAMVACGVNLFGFDQLLPGDERLEALLWSWVPGETGQGGAAYQDADGRFRRDAPGHERPAACRTADGWEITAGPVKWQKAAEACSAEFAGADFSVPRTPTDNAALDAAKGGSGSEVWLDYRWIGGAWTPETAG